MSTTDLNGDHDVGWWIGAGLEASLRRRAPEHYASTPMVRQLAIRVGHRVGLDAVHLKRLDLAVRVRDIGMVGLPDALVLATGTLSPADWALVTRHPILGAELLEQLDPIACVATVVRAHHERWDGGGYPDGTSGEQIPLPSRVIAACDAFVAIANDRPHRRGVGDEPALEQVWRGRGTQFDPQIVDALVAAIAEHDRGQRGGQSTPEPARRSSNTGPQHAVARRELLAAITEFDLVPASPLAFDRLLSAIEAGCESRGEIVAAVEADTGLTVAVLRRAQGVATRHPVANVPDAVNALTVIEIREATASLPRGDFSWRTTDLEVLMQQSRVHAQTVARAVMRIGQASKVRDDLVAAALLHDVGKLVLARADCTYASVASATSSSPEQRLQQERRLYGMDHASLGALLVSRWRLPKALARAVASHHIDAAQDEPGTYVRLGDMVAHHVQGDVVNRTTMLRLANACGLTAASLRDLLFELPHSSGSDRRRAEPTPLSRRETTVLILLAQGKAYNVIAAELDLSASTIRTHLHNTYAKLGVTDRAQAVLKATAMAWI